MEADDCASLQREGTSSSASSGCIRGRRGFGGRGVVRSTFSEQIPAFPWINPALTDEEQRCVEQSWQTIFRFNPNLRDTLDRPGIYRPPQAALTNPLVTQPQLPTSIPSKKKSSKIRLRSKIISSLELHVVIVTNMYLLPAEGFEPPIELHAGNITP